MQSSNGFNGRFSISFSALLYVVYVVYVAYVLHVEYVVCECVC